MDGDICASNGLLGQSADLEEESNHLGAVDRFVPS